MNNVIQQVLQYLEEAKANNFNDRLNKIDKAIVLLKKAYPEYQKSREITFTNIWKKIVWSLVESTRRDINADQLAIVFDVDKKDIEKEIAIAKSFWFDKGEKTMNKRYDYQVIKLTNEYILIKDNATIENFAQSVTNAADDVVEELIEKFKITKDMRIFYEDTEKEIDELCHNGESFTGFSFGHKGVDF